MRVSGRLGFVLLCFGFIVLAGVLVLACQAKEGPQGPEGPQGLQGVEGPQGPQGETGPAGTSALDPGIITTGTASSYVGVDVCALCHNGGAAPDTVTGWLGTGHAHMFENRFATYDPARDYCVKCHTTGFDTAIDNRGFDDLARAAGWTPGAVDEATGVPGGIMAFLKSFSLDQIKEMPMGKLINIQCESCHGPGIIHPKTVDWTGDVCAKCHTQNQGLANSPHVTGLGVGPVDADNHEGGSADCARCHTGQGYVVGKVGGQTLVFPGTTRTVLNIADNTTFTIDVPANMLPGDQQTVIACGACHDPHDATNEFQLRVFGNITIPAGDTVAAGVSATCVNCHANKRDAAYLTSFINGDKSRGVHDNSQADVFYGKGYYDFGGANFWDSPPSNSYHTSLEEGCVQCHMAPTLGRSGRNVDTSVPGALQVGEHSFQMEAGGAENAVNACGGCHAGLTTFNRLAGADYDGDGAIEGIQSEVQGMLDVLGALLPQNEAGTGVISEGISTSDATELERGGLWNYWLITNDGSLGIHNTQFTVQLLRYTYKALTGNEYPGAPG